MATVEGSVWGTLRFVLSQYGPRLRKDKVSWPDQLHLLMSVCLCSRAAAAFVLNGCEDTITWMHIARCHALVVHACLALAARRIALARLILTFPVTAVLAFVATNVVAAFLVLWAAVLATANIALWAALLAGPHTAADTGLLAADLGAGRAAADIGIFAADFWGAAAFARRGAVFAAALATSHDDSFYMASVRGNQGRRASCPKRHAVAA